MASPDGSGRMLRARLDRLERGRTGGALRLAPRPLPVVLADDAPADALERLRAAGIEAVRFAEFVECCV